MPKHKRKRKGLGKNVAGSQCETRDGWCKNFLSSDTLLDASEFSFPFEFFAGAQNTRHNDGHAHHSAGSIWCGLSHWIVELSDSARPYSGFRSYCCRQLCCHKTVRSVASFGQIVRRARSTLPRPGMLIKCNTGSISCLTMSSFSCGYLGLLPCGHWRASRHARLAEATIWLYFFHGFEHDRQTSTRSSQCSPDACHAGVGRQKVHLIFSFLTI